MNETPKNPNAVALGRLGGRAGRGQSKARPLTTEQARERVAVRWAKRKAIVVVPMPIGTCSNCGKANVEIDSFGICQACG